MKARPRRAAARVPPDGPRRPAVSRAPQTGTRNASQERKANVSAVSTPALTAHLSESPGPERADGERPARGPYPRHVARPVAARRRPAHRGPVVRISAGPGALPPLADEDRAVPA